LEATYLTLEEIKACELNILRTFHAFCEAHGLTYFLAGGTLLGAIRHKGFIPWDDDIDVMMPRPDAMRLLELARDGLDEHLKLDTWYLDKTSTSTMIKIVDTRTRAEFEDSVVQPGYGVWIDVFVADGVPDDPAQNRRDFKRTRLLMDLLTASLTRIGAQRRTPLLTVLQYGLLPVILPIRVVGYHTYIRKMFQISMRYGYEDHGKIAVYEGRGGIGEIMEKKELFPRIKVPFEGEEFYTMHNYDAYLHSMYGDYMTPPPPEKQVSRHLMKVTAVR